MKKLIAYSGGLESTISLLLAINKFGKDNILPIYIYDKRWRPRNREVNCVKSICAKLNIIPLIVNANDYTNSCKNRAAFFILDIFPHLAQTYNVDTIFWGEEKYNRESFFIHNTKAFDPFFLQKTNLEYTQRGYSFIADSLVKDIEKQFIVSVFISIYNQFGISPIFDTWSCFVDPNDSRECGCCSSCFEKYYALREADFTQDEILLQFVHDPLYSDYAKGLPKNITKLKNINTKNKFASKYKSIIQSEIQQLINKLNFVSQEAMRRTEYETKNISVNSSLFNSHK